MADSERYSSDSNQEAARNTNRNARPKPEVPPLPPSNPALPLLVGVGGGLLILAISVATTFANAPIYREAAQLGDKITYQTASFLLGLSCLNYLIALVAAYFVGFFVAKKAIRRMYGFYAGALTGMIAYIGGALVQYIPGYPGQQAAAPSNAPVLGGIAILVGVAVIWALFGGLMGLWGARSATKHEPHYVIKQQILDEEW